MVVGPRSFSSIILITLLPNNMVAAFLTAASRRIVSSSAPRVLFASTYPRFMSSASEILESLPSGQIGNDVGLAAESLANADAVCFDVDSTVIAEEGIDTLADFLGKGEAVAELTKQAMEGSTKFQDALKARLDLMEPSREQILDCLEKEPLELSEGIASLVESLHEAGKDVFLVSGGFRIMIEPVAKELCISKTNIYANTILFDDDAKGTYKGFDANEPTSQDMGKPRALEMIASKYGYENMVMVGDGATDAQAKPPAKAFIGYGGVVVREAVKEKACWFVEDFSAMEQVVKQFGGSTRSS